MNIQSELTLYPGISEGGLEEGAVAKWEQEGNDNILQFLRSNYKIKEEMQNNKQ